MKEAHKSPSAETIYMFRSYLEMGLRNVFMMMLDLFSWEQLTLAAGLIGAKEQASQIILIYLMSLCYSTGYGMQSPANALIGCQMVQAKVEQARGYFRATALFILAVLIVQISALFLGKEYILNWIVGLSQSE